MKILICSTQFPGYGGGATNSYNIHKFLQWMGFVNTYVVFFVHDKFYNMEGFDYNPEKLNNVMCYNRKDIDYKAFVETVNSTGSPDILLCKNIWAARVIPPLFDCAKVYLVSGSASLTEMFKTDNNICYSDVDISKSAQNAQEVDAINLNDYVMCNSEISYAVTKNIYDAILHDKCGRLYTTYVTSLCTTQNYDFSNKTNCIDVAYLASNFDRSIKGKSTFEKIAHQCEKRNMSITFLVVGDNYDTLDLPVSDRITFYKMSKVCNSRVIELLFNTKVLLVPSLYEACPNIMHEALSCGTNVLTSRNVGSHEILDEGCIVNSYHDVDEWCDKINALIHSNTPVDSKYSISIITQLFEVFYISWVRSMFGAAKSKVLHVDYDFLKLFGMDAVQKLTTAGYMIMLPDICYSIDNRDIKYQNQVIKFIRQTKTLISDNKSNIYPSSKREVLSMYKHSDDYVVYTNTNASKIEKHFPKVKIFTKMSAMNGTGKNKLVINLYPSDKSAIDICRFVSEFPAEFEHILILSSINKYV